MMVHRKRTAGFTLLELMIVVGIVAILASLAIAGYGFAMVKSRRAAAEGCLQEGSQYMERFFTTNLAYDKDTGGTNVTAPVCSQDVTPYYALTFSAGPTATSYTLQAAPTTKQKDPRCGTLTIDNKGIKTASGTAGVTGCW